MKFGDAAEGPARVRMQLAALHERLIGGDRVASEEIFAKALQPLIRLVERRWSKWSHTDVVRDAAIDAILHYLDAPERFDPERGALLSWLMMIAHRDLINLQNSGKQRTAIETPAISTLAKSDGVVTDLPLGATPISPAWIGPDPAIADRLDNLDIWDRIRVACPDEHERELIWACWVEGERSSDRLARIIGVDHLPVEERRLRVKNARDVAKRKLQRMGLMDDEHD